MFIFDLMETEVFDDTLRKDPGFEDELTELNEKVPQKGRKKAFVADKVVATFGVPMEENQQALQLENMTEYVDRDSIAVRVGEEDLVGCLVEYPGDPEEQDGEGVAENPLEKLCVETPFEQVGWRQRDQRKAG